jgi:opacity protein-like surface antigen
MKKYGLFIAVLALICFVTPVMAQSTSSSIINTEPSLAERWYLGGGFQLDIPNFKTEYVTVEGDDDLGVSDFDNTWGLQLKAGYNILDYLAVEGIFQYHRKFEWESDNYSDPDLGTVSGKVEVSGFDFSVNLKGILPLGIFRPYAVAGLGFMRGKAKATGTYDSPWTAPVSYSETQSDSGPMGRIGIGCDVFVSENFGIEAEVAYNAGMGDIDYARFTALSAGVIILL